jgi:hypothetical protein
MRRRRFGALALERNNIVGFGGVGLFASNVHNILQRVQPSKRAASVISLRAARLGRPTRQTVQLTTPEWRNRTERFSQWALTIMACCCTQ